MRARWLLVVALTLSLAGCDAADDGATVRDRDGSGELRQEPTPSETG